MNNEDLKKIQNITKSFRKLNSKMKLIVLLNKAKASFDENNFEECLASCKQILKKEPANSVALRALGCVMQASGKTKKAEIYYKRALKYSKNKEIEYTLLGTLYYNENDLEKALEFYNKAIEVNDNYDLAFEGRNQTILEKHLQILDLQDDLIKQNLF